MEKKETSKKRIGWRQLIVRCLLLLLAFVLGTACMLPFLLRRILNIGNAVGMVLALLLLVYALFMGKIHSLIADMWKVPAGKLFLSLLGLAVLVCFVFFIAINICMVRAALREPPQNTTIVVLGCKVHGERPSVMLESRLRAAGGYLREHPEAKCILSGGQGPDESMPEAECMRQWMLEQGIDEERLYVEAFSTSTRENLLYSSQIILERGMEPEIAIVTNEFHCYRASVIAGKLGLESYCIPAATPAWLFPTYYLREIFGVMYEWFL